MVLAGVYTGALKHRCSDGVSETWGCYADVRRPRWNMPCTLCLGHKGDSKCPECHGHGFVGQHRCPNVVNTGVTNFAYSFYVDMANHGILPVEGGLLNQSSLFLKVVNTFPAFEGAWRTAEETKKELLESRKKNGSTIRNRVPTKTK